MAGFTYRSLEIRPRGNVQEAHAVLAQLLLRRAVARAQQILAADEGEFGDVELSSCEVDIDLALPIDSREAEIERLARIIALDIKKAALEAAHRRRSALATTNLSVPEQTSASTSEEPRTVYLTSEENLPDEEGPTASEQTRTLYIPSDESVPDEKAPSAPEQTRTLYIPPDEEDVAEEEPKSEQPLYLAQEDVPAREQPPSRVLYIPPDEDGPESPRPQPTRVTNVQNVPQNQQGPRMTLFSGVRVKTKPTPLGPGYRGEHVTVLSAEEHRKQREAFWERDIKKLRQKRESGAITEAEYQAVLRRIEQQRERLSREGVVYFAPEQREETRVTVQDGLLHHRGKPLTTEGKPLIGEVGKGIEQRSDVMIWAMSPDGDLHVVAGQPFRIHHSSIFAGGDVLCAGEIVAKEGRLTLLTNQSGHYKPKPHTLIAALKKLEEQGLDVSGSKVRIFGLGLNHYISDQKREKFEKEGIPAQNVAKVVAKHYRDEADEISARARNESDPLRRAELAKQALYFRKRAREIFPFTDVENRFGEAQEFALDYIAQGNFDRAEIELTVFDDAELDEDDRGAKARLLAEIERARRGDAVPAAMGSEPPSGGGTEILVTEYLHAEDLPGSAPGASRGASTSEATNKVVGYIPSDDLPRGRRPISAPPPSAPAESPPVSLDQYAYGPDPLRTALSEPEEALPSGSSSTATTERREGPVYLPPENPPEVEPPTRPEPPPEHIYY